MNTALMRTMVGLALGVSLLAGAAVGQDRLVRLPDHRRIHLNCTGAGKVTVILEAGFGADNEAWYKVQPKLSQTMRVCSYDRAGAGTSDPGPYPRDGKAIANDLDQALRAANIQGPYIGVGHSSGGLYMRLFAAKRASAMTGMVLVDPSVEHAIGWEGIRDRALTCLRFAEKPPTDKADPLWKRCDSTNVAKWKTQVSEIETLFTSTSDQVDAKARKTGAVRTIILSADQSGMAGAHAQMARRFQHAEQRIIPSGHMMFFDQPEAIIAAVNDLAKR
jgi:pimeloyl-ACP methyl ester carboxylesterase